MHYYIDGYNLLFRLSYHHISLKQERERIIQDLSDKLSLLKLDATLVFDSIYAKGEGTESFIKDLKIVFTKEKETADEWIIASLKRAHHPLQHTVVSSDKQLLRHAVSIGAKTLSIETFASWLSTRLKNTLHSKKKKRDFSKTVELIPPLKKTEEKQIIPPETGSLEYYMHAFQGEVQGKIQDDTPPPSTPLKLKKAPVKRISDHERWLQVFNRELQDDNHS